MSGKRELIDTGTDKRSVRRSKRGTSFVESDDVGRSLALDRRRRAKTKVRLAKLEIPRHFRSRYHASRSAACIGPGLNWSPESK